jgi:hypothetical protein
MAKQNKTIQLNQGLHQVAIAQARSLANQANDAQIKMGKNHQLHDVLTFLVLTGLSMELYFKAIMLVARGGKVTKGHELSQLYNEFPVFLKTSLNQIYAKEAKAISLPITVIAIAQRAEKPNTPEQNGLNKNFESFDSAIDSVSNSFTRARYFFEEVSHDYTYIEFPVGQISALISALDQTYDRYLQGDFVGSQA